MKKISLSAINQAIKKTGGDVCQIGVELANKYSKGDADYDDIWSGAQDVFNQKTMEDKPYHLKKSKEKLYARKLYLYYLKDKHKGTATEDR